MKLTDNAAGFTLTLDLPGGSITDYVYDPMQLGEAIRNELKLFGVRNPDNYTNQKIGEDFDITVNPESHEILASHKKKG